MDLSSTLFDDGKSTVEGNGDDETKDHASASSRLIFVMFRRGNGMKLTHGNAELTSKTFTHVETGSEFS